MSVSSHQEWPAGERPAAWDRAEFQALCNTAVGVLADHIEASLAGREPVVQLPPVERLREELQVDRWIESGGMSATELAGFLGDFLKRSTHLHHPGSLAHQVAVPDVPAVVADLVLGATNNPPSVYEMGPAAVATELAVIDWMLARVGWSSTPGPGRPAAGGVLTHGGSLANLTALLAARAHAEPDAWAEGVRRPLGVLVAPGAHFSIRRALSILGLGAEAALPVGVDGRDVIDPDRLPGSLRRARQTGRRVFALAASACATSTGLYDPLEEIARFCEEEGLWLHVDAAHGASALVSARERRLLRGLERADSVVWDAHKLLRTSGLCTALLCRDGATLGRALRQQASYLFYGEGDHHDIARRTIECTRTSMALKIFLNLAVRGERGLARYVEGQFALARSLHTVIQARPGFECLCVPESNILCFRYRGDDALQVRVREALLAGGRFHVTSAEVGGRRWLRLTLMNPAADVATVEPLLDEIVRLVESEAA